MWRKANPSTLLVGMQTGVATVEKSMEFPQKTKSGTSFDPAIPMLGLYPKNPETPIQKNLCTPMFIAAQFTIAKYWNNLRAHQQMSGSKNYGVFTQWNSTQQRKRRSLYPLQQNGWNWRALC